jgi:hypothetical protein
MILCCAKSYAKRSRDRPGSGLPGHLAPWTTMFAAFEVNFLPELKHLHDAGYNILTYDPTSPLGAPSPINSPGVGRWPWDAELWL